MADKLMAEGPKNHCIDRIRAGLAVIHPDGEKFARACDDLQVADPLPKLLAQYLSHRASKKGVRGFEDDDDPYASFMARDVKYAQFGFDALLTYPGAKNPAAHTDDCQYHTHVDTPKCVT